MIEGWHGEDYLILYTESEFSAAEARYGFAALLPGFRLVGLRGWDDFIVVDEKQRTFCVPTLPLDTNYLAPYAIPSDKGTIRADTRFSGKIKWYRQPLIFGGDAEAKENMTWVNHEQHGQLVRWWNQKYKSIPAKR